MLGYKKFQIKLYDHPCQIKVVFLYGSFQTMKTTTSAVHTC